MKKIVLLLLFLFSSFFLNAQIAMFQKTYGGIHNDGGSSIEQTSDGGYIISGSTISYGKGSADVYLIKLSSDGDTLWAKTFGTTSSEGSSSTRQTNDGGYIVSGGRYILSTSTNNIYLIKTKSNGDTLWTKTYGGTNNVSADACQLTTDGGYIVCGNFWSPSASTSEASFLKINSSGNIQWSKQYSANTYNSARFVQQTNDGGYIIAGHESGTSVLTN